MRLAACVVATLLLAGCGKERRTAEVSSAATCTRCHGGGDNSTGAPPLDGHGQSDTSLRSVGAHTAHVGGGRVLAPLGCEACHLAPSPDDPLAHVDGETRIQLGIAARNDRYPASYDVTTARCDVYCHGATLSGGSTRQPVWTVVRPGGTPPDCGACHGDPPPFPHPARTDCEACHAETIRPGTGREIDVARGLHVNGVVEMPLGCTGCHGDPARPRNAAAPPAGTHGETLPSERAVGAHQAHLEGGTIARAITCVECHQLPGTMDHADGAVDLAFGATARARGAAPRFDAASVSCASTYCHGATISGGSIRTPSWTGGPSQAACGTCHGVPPPSHGPAATSCDVCHPGTVLPGGAIDVNGGMHVNGALEVERYHPAGWESPLVHGLAANRDLDGCRRCHGAELAGGIGAACSSCHGEGWQSSCTFCHGDPNRATNEAAPPEGTQNELATSARAVGAHQPHLRDGAIRQAVECAECHTVPTDLSHVTGTPELTWGALARGSGAAPRFEGGRCAATYCHGATLGAGGTNQAPTWTVVDGTEAACGTCHGTPPPRPHPQIATCRPCHPQTIAEGGGIDVAGGAHVNGVVERSSYHPLDWFHPAQHGYAANRDLASCRTCHGADLDGGTSGVSCSACHQVGWQSNCTFCHGDAARQIAPAAPPVGTQGESSTADRAVGAHARHVEGGPLSPPVACAECHLVPSDLAHVNGAPALTWGPLARAHGATPGFGGATCSGVYCHGATLAAGGTNTTPAWTVVDGSQAACGTCHGVPPPSPHPQNPACGTCHPGAGAGTVSRDTHVNGTLELSALACSACHGDASRPVAPAAPPVGTNRETSTTERAVGAHQSHVQAGSLARAFGCAECHLEPADLGHIDGTPAVVFGTLGGAGTWNGATCSASYCHGATLHAGGSNVEPTWTVVDGSQAACGACHGTPPPPPHPGNPDCAACHPGYTSGSVNLGTHVDGNLDLAGLTCSSCHGDASRAVAPAAPPVGTRGETATTSRAVGAHQAHLGGTALGVTVACTECHEVPASLAHADLTVDLRFGPLATDGGTTVASWDGATCANYCHGGTMRWAGGSNTTPRWTGGPGEAACGSCHGVPPPAPHPPVAGGLPGCAACHPQTVSATGAIIPAASGGVHLDGAVQGTGHGPGWMDRSSLEFHAYEADRGLASCTSCHGAELTRCGDCHDTALPPGVSSWRQNCLMCHGGTDNLTGAPPRAIWGRDADAVRVGAHTRHLSGSDLAPAFDCAVCHVTPADALSPGHVDTGTATVTFGGLATAGAAAPTWIRSSATCASTYCHGGTLDAGGDNTAPSWIGGAGEASCGSCHGLPPPAPHPAASGLTTCAGCHPETVDAAGRVIPPSSGGRHLDGVLQVEGGHGDEWMRPGDPGFHAYSANAGLASCQGCHGARLDALSGGNCATCHGGSSWPTSCTMCHGGVDNQTGAPPKATYGQGGDPIRVGAHSAHVEGGPTSPPFDCIVCHTVPDDAFSPGHIDGSTAAVTFAGLAVAPAGTAPAPTWTRTGATCASTYCHGASLAGGTNTTPSWTGGAGQATCGSCHGLPPPAPHPGVAGGLSGCATCHNGTVDAGGALIPPATGGLHLNGVVDAGSLEAGCTSCHGLPPADGGRNGHVFHGQQRLDCGACHAGYTRSGTVDPAYHMNGVRDARFLYLTPNPDPGPDVPPTLEACEAWPATAIAVMPPSTDPTVWDFGVCTACHQARDYRYNRCCADAGAPGAEWCADYW